MISAPCPAVHTTATAESMQSHTKQHRADPTKREARERKRRRKYDYNVQSWVMLNPILDASARDRLANRTYSRYREARWRIPSLAALHPKLFAR